MHTNKIKWLESLFGKGKYYETSKELLVHCKFCNHYKKKLSINVERDLWKCFVCGKRGQNLYSLLRKSAYTTKQDIELYADTYKSKITQGKEDHSQLNFRLTYPDNFQPIADDSKSFFARKAYKYLSSRNVDDDDILCHKIGVITDGQNKGCVVVPSFNVNGNLNWYTVRSTLTNWKSAPPVPRGYKDLIIPNELNLDWTKPIVLVEGPFDWLKSTENTVPLYGNWLSTGSALFNKIISSQIPVFLALDPDASRQSYKIAKNLMRRLIIVYTVDVYPFKDVGCMTKKEFKLRYDCAQKIDDAEIFRRRLESLR